MATLSHAQAVKSLNKSFGRRRFVFKTFFQKIEEIEIDVFRSLDKVKSEPSEGSSFFRDCLIEWRELNTAEDFISLYEDMMPIVQTLPLVLLNKELIISKLLSRLQMEARLSLDPILKLMAALSRDLLEDFIYFLPKVVDSLVSLLKAGGDREPEIVEQIFTSWSYMLMYLQKYIVRDVVNVLKMTSKLRYYPKGHVQELMAAATSFLLRNAPEKQLRRGIRKLMLEVLKKPLPLRKSGISALLYFIMRGMSSRFHSRAERLLQMLTDNSILCVGDTIDQGSCIVVDVVITAFERLCEEFKPAELALFWNCLYHRVDGCITSHSLQHLNHILLMLVSAVRVKNGERVSDYRPILERMGSIVQTYILCSFVDGEKDHFCEVIDSVLELMLCILDGLINSNAMSLISRCSVEWAPVFESRSLSCLTFLHELLAKNSYILCAFSTNILSALNYFIEVSPQEGIHLLLTLCERLEKDGIIFSFSSKICDFVQEHIFSWVRLIKNITSSNEISSQVSELALLWGIICCYPTVMAGQSNSSSLMNLVDALAELLMFESENIASVPRSAWESLIGTALRSCCKCGKGSVLQDTGKVLHLVRTCKSSSQVMSAVADYFDHVHGPMLETDSGKRSYHPAMDMFTDNLFNPSKEIRVSTLRILRHYEIGVFEQSISELQDKIEVEAPQNCLMDVHGMDVLQLLLLVETTTLSVATSRKVILLISQMQMGLAAGSMSEVYAPILLCGILGVFHNRFNCIWNAASETLAVLIDKYGAVVWDKFVHYFEQWQAMILSSYYTHGQGNAELVHKSSDLVERFNSSAQVVSDCTPNATVLTLLLQSMQKVSPFAESHSRQIIPLFLKFVGYNEDGIVSWCSYNSDACKGKEWQVHLKEWLNLLKLFRNPKALYRSQLLKDILQFRLIDDNDHEVQMKVLDTLLLWKDDYLLPYVQNLRNLISSKKLREELTTWSLDKASGPIAEGHRHILVPLVFRILMPKIRKLKILASRKRASVYYRKAILRFVAQVDIEEVPVFFSLLLRPVTASKEASLDEIQSVGILKYFTMEKMMAISWKKISSFLHVIEEVLGAFNEVHIRPFVDLLMGSVMRILEICTSGLEVANGVEFSSDGNLELHGRESQSAKQALMGTNVKQFKDLRSLCLKIICLILNKYDDHNFSCEYWDMFFTLVKPLIEGFKEQGSTSEKPSTLFSCFLAMSQSYHLGPLLSREKNLIGGICSILTVHSASEAVISSVLQFIENLLILDEELDYRGGENALKSLLLLNLDELTTNLHSLFEGKMGTKRKLADCTGDALVRILKLLSKFIVDPPYAGKLLDVLLHLLTARSKDSDTSLECLQVIQLIIPVLGTDSTRKILTGVSQLLISSSLDMRLHICRILETMAKYNPSVLIVAKLVRELNATSDLEVDVLDYDTINNAYGNIGIGFFSTVQRDLVLVVLSHCVYDMSSEELVLRSSAYGCLLSFIEFCALILTDTKDDSGGDQVMMMNEVTNNETGWTSESIKSTIDKFLLEHMMNSMKGEKPVRKEWIELLREMVLKLPGVTDIHSCKALCSEDAEQDFFCNIIHLQKHRRARALSQFKIVSSAISQDILRRVFLPFFLRMLFDVRGGKDDHVRNAFLEAVAKISACLEWKWYNELLKVCFHEIKMKVDKQKILSRLICSILDQFHFAYSSVVQEVQDSLDNTSVLKTHSSMIISSKIQARLRDYVLPQLQKLLDSDRDKVNVILNLAVLKVLKLLPVDIMDSQLPIIIHRIATNLKSRSESSRDEARLALAACLKELGLDYLQFVVGILRGILQRGYELHVLGYSLNFLLSRMVPDFAHVKLDYCLDDLLAVVVNDMLGDVAEEKAVEKIASKMKETRKIKSFETLEMIAQGITFRSHALKLLSPVITHMQNSITPKLEKKLQKMLHHIALGIESNPSVDQKDLFIFIYGLIENGINQENGLDPIFSVKADMCRPNDTCGSLVMQMTSSHREVGSDIACHHLITEFSLCLFHKRIKKVKLDKKNEEVLSMLDPFVQLLSSCLNSKYEDLLSVTLRCINLLVRLPLPSLQSQADKIKLTLLDVAQSSLNANSPLMQSCLRLLAYLLQSTKITLSSEHLHMLIQFPLFTDLERNPSSIALSLLKAIVHRKLVVPDIYDLVIRVAELMVTSQLDSIRKKCDQIVMQFLLDYHLSDSYLQQHLGFLLKNLSYEHSTGREAVLEMLYAIMKKFPQNFLDKHAQQLYIHLVQCMANDSDHQVRSMAGAAIKQLHGCTSPHVNDSIFFNFTLSWYMGEKRQLQSVGAQALGLLVEVAGKSFQKHISILLPIIKNILQSAVSTVKDNVVPFWKEAYFSLVLLEKILHCFPDTYFLQDLEDIWQAICELLLHPHLWLRNISNRLVFLYFSAVTDLNRKKHGEELGRLFLMKLSRLFSVAASLCCQMRAQVINGDAISLISKNLVFALYNIHSLMEREELSDPCKFLSYLEGPENSEIFKAFCLLDSRKGGGLYMHLVSSLHNHNVGNQRENHGYFLVSNLLKTMGKIALESEANQMEIVFTSYLKISSQMSQDTCLHYAFDMLVPIYKVCEGYAGRSISDDIKQLAQGVSDGIRNAIGIHNFVQVYNEIRKNIKMKRDKRKREEKVMAVVNPVRSAKRKLQIAQKNRANKKRKIMTMKFRRWMH